MRASVLQILHVVVLTLRLLDTGRLFRRGLLDTDECNLYDQALEMTDHFLAIVLSRGNHSGLCSPHCSSLFIYHRRGPPSSTGGRWLNASSRRAAVRAWHWSEVFQAIVAKAKDWSSVGRLIML
uniref:Secreted protein n=1 Tax=Leersia perrieri TaxID=77586 RepID=A0A0D9WN35_9ORYZ